VQKTKHFHASFWIFRLNSPLKIALYCHLILDCHSWVKFNLFISCSSGKSGCRVHWNPVQIG